VQNIMMDRYGLGSLFFLINFRSDQNLMSLTQTLVFKMITNPQHSTC
jgi:hypothetical protein